MISETDTAAVIQTVQDNARRLGLSWDLTMAKVAQSSGADPTNVSVIFDSDADSGAVTAGLISMVGVLAPGARVFVITVPPAGNYIVGVAGAGPKLIAYGRRSAAKSGITADSGLVGLEWAGIQGHMYYVTSTVMTIASTLNEILQFGITLRLAADGVLASTAHGTQFGNYLGSTIAGTGGGAGVVDGVYTPPTDIPVVSVCTSIRRIVGGGTVTASDGGGGGPQILVYDLGIALPNKGRTL